VNSPPDKLNGGLLLHSKKKNAAFVSITKTAQYNNSVGCILGGGRKSLEPKGSPLSLNTHIIIVYKALNVKEKLKIS
jgi:hypothetical protein